MSAIRRIVLLLSVVLPALGAGTASAQQGASREGYRDKYSVLSERNIFLRERGRRRSEEPSFRPSYTRRAEDGFVLRGVVAEEGQFHAYVESLSSYSVLKLAIGDAVASGKIASIEMDAIDYEQGGRRTRIEVGQTLTGGPVPTSEPAQSGGSDPATQPASGPPINPNDPNLTLEQKMKLRRMQEVNRK